MLTRNLNGESVLETLLFKETAPRHLTTVLVCIPGVKEFSLLRNHTNEIQQFARKGKYCNIFLATNTQFWAYIFTLIHGDKNVLNICEVL